MQDGQLSNTPFEQQLNESDFGKFVPGTSTLAPLAPVAGNIPTTVDALTQSLVTQGQLVGQNARKQENPFKEPQISPLILDLTGRFNQQLVGADTEDLYAQAQTTWDKMANGALKGFALAGTTFLQGTLGLVYGMAEAIGQGRFSALYDNDFSNAMNYFNTSLENKLPNYYTARERSADWWEPANIFTANFLWDKLVKNLGFSIGAIYSGAAVTKALRLVPEAFGLSKAKLLQGVANEMEATLTALPPAQRANAAASQILSASRTTSTLNAALSPVERIMVSTLGAATEGGIEALQGVNEWRAQKIEEYKQTYGEIPTGEDMQKINEAASSLGNARFGMNIALLTATNYIQLPRILSSSYKDSKIIANGVEKSISPVVRDETSGLFRSTLPTSRVGKALFKTRNVASLFFSPTEAFEEFSQYAVQRGVEDYYNKAYRGDGRNWLESMAEGYARASSDKEGLEQLLIGGISGGIQQAGFISVKGVGKTGAIGERGVTGTGGERARTTGAFLDALNKSKETLKADSWLEAMAKSAARGINLQIEGQNYLRQGDILEVKDNDFDYQHNYLYPRIQHDRMDLVLADVENYRYLAGSPDGWRMLKEKGIATQNDTPATFLTRLAAFEKNARNINSLYQSLDVRYGGVINKDGSPKYSPEVIEKMVYAAAKVANYDERIPQVGLSLASAGISTLPVTDNVILNGTVSESATKEALAQINNLNVLSDVKDQLKSDLRDIIELSLRRKAFLDAYDTLKANPDRFSGVEADKLPTKTTIGDKEVEIGREYSLSQPLFREGNKLSISPTLTVLSATLGGELEVRTPTGEITYKRPRDVSYDLIDGNVTDVQYNALAEKAIDRVIGEQEGANTLEQKLSYINAQNDKQLTDDVEAAITADTKTFLEQQKKIREANEQLKKNATLNKQLDEQQKKLDGEAGVETKNEPTAEDVAKADVMPKAPLPAFLSKEADFYDEAAPKPHQKRRLAFLSNFPDFSDKKAAKIGVLAISKSNEGRYGLTGLVDWVTADIENSRMDAEQRAYYLDENGKLKKGQEPIVKLYVINTKNGIRPVDVEGKAIENPGGENALDLLLEEGVFGVFHSDVDGVYKFGPRQGQNNYSGNYDSEDLEAIRKSHNAWREKILSSTESPLYPIAAVSRGIVLRDEENKPVTATSLATEDDLKNKEKIITIPTIEGFVIGDISYNFTPGIPLLTNGANVDFLNNRTFSEDEAEEIFKLIRYRVENSGTPEAARVEQYLASILYLRSPRPEETSISPSQVFHTVRDNRRQYFFGDAFAVDFNVHALDSERDSIIEFFRNYFVKTNNKLLTEQSALGYEQAFTKPDGTVDFRQFPSYQYFLLSTKANAVPFLQTRARRSIAEDDPTIIHRYTTLKSSEFQFAAKPKPLTEEQEQIKVEREEKPKGSLFGTKKKRVEKAPITEGETPASLRVQEIRPGLWIGFKPNSEGKLEEVQGKTKEEVEKKIGAPAAKAEKSQPVATPKPQSSDVSAQMAAINEERGHELNNIYKRWEVATAKGKAQDIAANKAAAEINAKYDAELAALEGKTTEKPVEQQLSDEERKRRAQAKSRFKGKNPSTDKGEFRFANRVAAYQPIDIDKELKAINEKSPFSTEILTNLIRTSDGVYAWGQYKDMLISLYQNAKAGTGYHELFEGVWKVFTTKDQKTTLLKEFRGREGQFSSFDGKSTVVIPYSEATDWQAKEKLADEFADYMLARQEPKGNAIVRWFKQLWELIKSIFDGKIDTIDALFQRINAGAYKSASPLYTDEETEYSFAQLPYTDQYTTIRGVALEVVRQAINPNRTPEEIEQYGRPISLTEWEESDVPLTKIYDAVYSRLREIFEEDIYSDQMTSDGKGLPDDVITQYENYWLNLKNNWPEVIAATNEFLKTFSIIEGIQDEGGNISRFDREDYSNREYVDDRKYFMNDAKNTASRSIKLLFNTLPETIMAATGLISDRDPRTLMEKQVNYAKTFNGLLTQLIPLNTYNEKIEKLEELGKTNPNFQRLFLRLTTPSNSTNPDSVLNDWKLKVRFYQAMSKQEPTPWIQYNQKDGTSYTQTANLNSSKKLVVQSWIDAMKVEATSGSSSTFSMNEGGDLILNTSGLRHNITTPDQKFEFLGQLGIVFTRQMYDTLSPAEAKKFNDGVAGLSHQLKKSRTMVLDTAKSLNAIKNMEAIAEASIASGNDFETTFLNIENERQATFISTNAISRWTNSINGAEYKGDLLKDMPQLAKITDSVYLNNVLFNSTGEKTSFNFDLGYIQGTVDQRGRSIPGSRLPMFDRLVQEINQNLAGRYYVLVPADGKTQWLLSMKNLVPYSSVVTGANDYQERTKTLFTTYYETEKAEYERLAGILTEKDLNSRQGVFKAISDNYTLSSEEFFVRIGEFFNNQIREQLRELEKYNVVVQKGTSNSYEWKGLDGDFAKANSLNPKALERQTLINILTFRTINFAINNVEMHKIFFGSALDYKDAKRWKLFMSPREISMYGSSEFNSLLNTQFNKNKPNRLTGQWTFSDYIPTVMMDDVITATPALKDISDKYLENNSADAQAWSHITAMRERRLKGGTWTDKDNTQYEYMMAQDRLMMLNDKVLQEDDASKENYYPHSMKKADEAVVSRGNPNIAYVYVEKPILSGHVQIDGEWSVIADKYSIVSLSYAAVRNTNFRDHYIKMMRQGIGYIITSSGRKVGKTKANTFYTADGEVNKAPYEGVTPVPFSAFGVQTDTSGKKETQTRGSQLTKLIIVNLYDNGVPISEEADRLAKQNIALLKEQTKIGYERLLKHIGAEDRDGRYHIIDKTKLVNIVKNELLRREVADNIKTLVSTKEGNPDELAIPFEALPNYVQIKNILYSYVDKFIIRPRVSGAPKVQVSGALMERYGVKKTVVNGKNVYTSSALHFYTKDEPWIDVLMPAWVATRLKEQGLRWENTEELYELFKSSPDANALLSGVGFRIPTQELNSVENFRIAGFLPEEFGDTVIVPEELPTKAGSDFDIDKLNTYLQNIYVDNKKQIRVIPYFGMGEEARKQLKAWLNKDVAEDWLLNSRTINPANYDSFEEYQTANPLDDVDFGKEEEKAAEQFERMYGYSIENEYYKNMQEILQLPENFERLTTPNTADTLKNIRDQLVDLSETFGNTRTPTIISPMFMLQTRHDGLSVKDLVGIAAVAQTGTASAQLSSIVIDPARMGRLRFRDKVYLYNNGQPLLPHNRINGKATLSSIKDVEGNYITDNNSQFINGTVDVFNDAFLPQINYNRRTSPLYHLMTRLGIPNSKKHPIVSFFMNQPIIRQYLGRLDIAGKASIIDKVAISKTLQQFKSNRNITSFPKGLDAITDLLRDSIKVTYGDGLDLKALSEEQKAYQVLIFREFLKYASLSNQLFRFQQGSSWDTVRMNDPNTGYMKDVQMEEAQERTIFSDLSSYLENSHIGTQRTTIKAANEVLSEVLPVQSDLVRAKLEPILSRVATKYITIDAKNKIAKKVEESLLNFLIQTKTGINNSLKFLMVDTKTALVNQLKAVKKTAPDTDSIWDNLILKQLVPAIKGRSALSTKNITLAVKPRDVYSKNLYNKAFQELYDNPKTRELARSLIKMSFLQNGVSNSIISYKDALPAQLYADTVNSIIGELQNGQALDQFINFDNFYKNNWNDINIVPIIYDEDATVMGDRGVINYINTLKTQGIVDAKAKAPLVIWVDVKDAKAYSPFLTYTLQEENEMGEPITTKLLMRRVEAGPEFGITRDLEDSLGEQYKGYMFIHVSALGDSYRAQEHYATPHGTVFQNGYANPSVDVNVVDLFDYLTGTSDEAEEIPPIAPIPTATEEPNTLPQSEPMDYKMPAKENIWGEDTSTMDEIIKGRRTSTTRGYWHNVEKSDLRLPQMVGKILTFKDKSGKSVDVVVTSFHRVTASDRKNQAFLDQWSAAEGWTKELLLRETKVGDVQLKFRLASPPLPISPENTVSSQPMIQAEIPYERGLETPYPGVVNIPDTGLTVAKANEFISLLQPQILNQAYVENKAYTANRMFSFGLRWAKNVPNETEKSKQRQEGLKQRPNKVKINAVSTYDAYGYYTTDQNNAALPAIKQLQPIIDFIESKLGIDMSDYDSVLANIYEADSFIHQHRDITESRSAKNYPVIVLNLGAEGGLIYHTEYSDETKVNPNANTYNQFMTNKRAHARLPIKNGGIYAFGVGGVNRFTFNHRVEAETQNTPTQAIRVPEWDAQGNKVGEKTLKNYRITLTFRRAQDLTSGIPTSPAQAIPALKAPVKEEKTPIPITEVTRASKKETYTITLENGEKEEREGYRLTIKEYPSFQGMIHGNSKEGWSIDELTTSKNLKGGFDTIKEAMAMLPEYLNKVFANPQNRPLLKQINLFTFEEFKNSLPRKDCNK